MLVRYMLERKKGDLIYYLTQILSGYGFKVLIVQKVQDNNIIVQESQRVVLWIMIKNT